MTRNPASLLEHTDRGRAVSRLLVHRTALGLTQAQLAQLAGIAPETVSNVERGRHHPRGLTVKALAAVLGVAAEELFNDEHPPTEAGAVKEPAGQGPTHGP